MRGTVQLGNERGSSQRDGTVGGTEEGGENPYPGNAGPEQERQEGERPPDKNNRCDNRQGDAPGYRCEDHPPGDLHEADGTSCRRYQSRGVAALEQDRNTVYSNRDERDPVEGKGS